MMQERKNNKIMVRGYSRHLIRSNDLKSQISHKEKQTTKSFHSTLEMKGFVGFALIFIGGCGVLARDVSPTPQMVEVMTSD
jgi:hypothetical protein